MLKRIRHLFCIFATYPHRKKIVKLLYWSDLFLKNPHKMLRKIFIALLLLVLSCTSLLPAAFAQTIPSNYVLVPLSALTGMPQAAVNTAPQAVLSTTRSTLRTSDGFTFINQSITATATLRESNGRAISGRIVTLTSSRGGDRIEALQAVTDNQGEAIFRVTGTTEGVATLIATDSSTGTTISERARVVFLSKKPVGGNAAKLPAAKLLRSDVVESADTAASSTTTDARAGTQDNQNYAEFVELDFPETVDANQPYDLTVRIVDDKGAPVENYIGTISFDTTDPAVTVGQEIPLPYSFKETDRGSHTFAQAVTFITPGRVTLSAAPSTPTTKVAEKVIIVKGSGTTSDAPSITAPQDGATFRSNTVTLTGTATPNMNLAVLVDDVQVMNGDSGEAGSFSIDVTDLTEGTHALTVAILDASDQPTVVSAAVNVTIDTTPPELKNFTVHPGETVAPGDQLLLTAVSEPGLAAAKLSANNTGAMVLSEDAAHPGTYTAAINAGKPGTYKLALHLKDHAGNVSDFTGLPTITVEIPTTITTIRTTAKNKRVDLAWDPPVNQTAVHHYVIHYGVTSGALDQLFETSDNRTAWYVDGLNNDTLYHFAIESVDANGVVNGKSVEASETPYDALGLAAKSCDGGVTLMWNTLPNNAVVRYQAGYGVKSGEYVETIDAVPGTNSIAFKNLINGLPYFFSLRGLDSSGQTIYTADTEVTATPGGESCHNAASVEVPILLRQSADRDGNLLLEWNPVPGATGYRVYAGTAPNYFDLPTATVTTTKFQPTDLPGNATYYFAVKAITNGNHESANHSNIIGITVGPAETLAIALGVALIMTSAWFWRRKLINV